MMALQITGSVTRLGDLLHFGHFFKAGDKNYFAQIPHIFCHFCIAINFGQLL